MWRHVLGELGRLYPSHACAEFLRGLPLLHFDESRVPQLEPLSRILR